MNINLKNCLLILVLFVCCSSNYSLNAKEKVIIAVHGLGDKQPADIYENWWKASILEGLENISSNRTEINLKLFYWADMLYKDPMHNDTSYYFDDKFDREPFLQCEVSAKPRKSWFNEKWESILQKAKSITIKSLYAPVPEKWTDMVLEKTLRDLSFYFENNIFVKTHDKNTMLVRDAIQRELIQIIKANRDKDILLIGHSMGSIITYDVLKILESSDPKIVIKYFLTAGSPMGIPPVMEKMTDSYNVKKLSVPNNIAEGWFNFSDPNDKAAFDPILEDNFQKNKFGMEITDELVTNDYVNLTGAHNYHKEYGYMRAKKISKLIDKFLNDK